MKRQIQWKMLWHCDSPTCNAVVSFSIHGRRNGENEAFLCKDIRRKYMNAKIGRRVRENSKKRLHFMVGKYSE